MSSSDRRSKAGEVSRAGLAPGASASTANPSSRCIAQLADILRKQILSGAYRPGERLPSEAMLVEMFDVSPMTVRRAINLLAAQEVVSTAQGRGVFVKEVELGSAAFDLYDLKELFNDETGTTVKSWKPALCLPTSGWRASCRLRPAAGRSTSAACCFRSASRLSTTAVT